MGFEQAGQISEHTRAGTLISQYVDAYRINELPKASNKLRAFNTCMNSLRDSLRKAKIDPRKYLWPGTIGDIDPWAIGLTEYNTHDDFEQGEFKNLTDRLGLDPEGKTYSRIVKEQKKIQISYKNKRLKEAGSWTPTRYYSEGERGSKEARANLVLEAKELGLEATVSDAWMGYGGMDILQRAARAVNTYFEQKITDPQNRRQSVLLTPTVGFNMAAKSMSLHGPEVTYVPTSDLLNNELTADRLKQYFEVGEQNQFFGEKGKIPDMMLLTPANNPTAQSSDPEKLKGVLETMIEYNKNVIFIFDMAYMWIIPRDKAMQIMNTIKETGADQRAIFVVSESKRWGQPGTRIAGGLVLNDELKEKIDINKMFNDDTMGNEPSWSGILDTYYQAASKVIKKEAFDDLAKLLRQRQQSFLEVIRELDHDHQLFDEEIERVVIPGHFDPQNKPVNAIELDVPLYLWLKLKNGVDAFEVLKKLGIGGAPSEVFGPEHGDTDNSHLRLSMGFLSTADILKASPAVHKRWKKKFPFLTQIKQLFIN